MEEAAGGAQIATAAGGVDEYTDMGSTHPLSNTSADSGGTALGVSQVVEASKAVGQQTQVGCGKAKRGLALIKVVSGLLLQRWVCLYVVGERSAVGLERRPDKKPKQGYWSSDKKEDKKDNGAEEDLEGVEVAFSLPSLDSLQGRGLVHSNEAVQEPEAGQY